MFLSLSSMILFLRIESAGYKGHKDKYDSIPAFK